MNDLSIEELDRVTEGKLPQADYDPPCIEKVITPDEMAREVLYAGLFTIPVGH